MKSMKSKPIEIRSFESSDAESCFRIRSEAFIKLFYDEIGPDSVVAGINAYLPEKYIQMAETMPIFMAVDGEAQIGFIAARFVEHATIEILFLYIRLDYLRKGIGSQLIGYLENWVRKHHPQIERIIVDTAVPKYNQMFYEKCGYSKIGESECQYPEGSVKAIRLMKNLR
jgi:GNAT superfamily N-acetyltransferase